MPKQYKACVASEVKSGKPKKTAQKICAISYYKKHGKSVQEAAKKEGKKVDAPELDLIKGDIVEKAYENAPKGGMDTNTGKTKIHEGTGSNEEGKSEELETGVADMGYLIPDMLPLTSEKSAKEALEHYLKHYGIYEIDQRREMVRKLRQSLAHWKLAVPEEELWKSLETNQAFETSGQTHSAGGVSAFERGSSQQMDMVKFYAPIQKIDEEKRMVYGYATTQSEDSQEEIVDLQASFDAVDDWAKWATIKEMHRQDTAAGTAPVIEKHPGVGVYIGAKIVDDQAWRKCQEKVYKGFSIGGHSIKKEKDT